MDWCPTPRGCNMFDSDDEIFSPKEAVEEPLDTDYDMLSSDESVVETLDSDHATDSSESLKDLDSDSEYLSSEETLDEPLDGMEHGAEDVFFSTLLTPWDSSSWDSSSWDSCSGDSSDWESSSENSSPDTEILSHEDIEEAPVTAEDHLSPQEIRAAKYGNETIYGPRTLLAVDLDAAVESKRAMGSTCMMNRTGRRFQGTRTEIFYSRLHLWIERLEERFCQDVCSWALRYAPAKPEFGVVTDFSRVAFMRIYRKSRCLSTEDLERFYEMLVALNMWAFGKGVNIVPMTFREAGGTGRQGVANLAAICVSREIRSSSCPVIERKVVWTGIMELVMEKEAEELKTGVVRMMFNMFEDVLPSWRYDINPIKRKLRGHVILRFIKNPIF